PCLPSLHSFPTRRSSDLKRYRRSILIARPSNSFDRSHNKRPGGLSGGGNVVSLVPDLALSGGSPTPSPQSLRGLDWFIFFLADRSEEHTSELQSHLNLVC